MKNPANLGRVNCYECACFEPMKKQNKPNVTLGACHLDPPTVQVNGTAHWPIVIKEFGYCFSGIQKEK